MFLSLYISIFPRLYAEILYINVSETEFTLIKTLFLASLVAMCLCKCVHTHLCMYACVHAIRHVLDMQGMRESRSELPTV